VAGVVGVEERERVVMIKIVHGVDQYHRVVAVLVVARGDALQPQTLLRVDNKTVTKRSRNNLHNNNNYMYSLMPINSIKNACLLFYYTANSRINYWTAHLLSEILLLLPSGR
jgi:hypothetical protein